ncbi:expressed protein [Echinococcus multilocularis]|uniref:Dynein light chain n=1 Tax=Echinococcus multilocularis TaxID=6211 RepID=A0A068YHU9_ECHMU|nr:expressed protein [Echinococcus multilocularis]
MLNLQRSDSSAESRKYSFEEEAIYSHSPGARQDRRRVTYTYENNRLLEDGEPVKATIHCSEMTPEMEAWAVDCAAIALINHASIKQASAYIKKEFDKKFGPSWQCVVGSHYGSYVSHFEGSFIYFLLKNFTVLLYQI